MADSINNPAPVLGASGQAEKIPNPYWVSADRTASIYLADCLKLLPLFSSDTFDSVVTSPPYNTLPQSNKPSGIHAERKSGVNQWISKSVDNGYFDDRSESEYQAWMVQIIEECLRVSCGLVWVNHKIRYREGHAIHPARMFPWPIYSEVIWDRSVSMALNCKRYAPSTEHLIGFGTPAVWNDELNKLMSVWRLGFDRDSNDHPCSFPVALAERPIRSSTPYNGIVLDPFCGSGTTGVACARTGRRFVGIEVEERYCEMAVDRINREMANPSLLSHRQSTPSQGGFWDSEHTT